MPTAVPRLDFLQFSSLVVCEISSHFPVRVDHDFVNPTPGIVSDFCKLGGCFVDNRRYLGNLFRRQIQFRAEPVSHSYAHYSRLMKFKKKMPRVCRTKKSARHPTRDKNEEEASN
jgi:hypothetical protein